MKVSKYLSSNFFMGSFAVALLVGPLTAANAEDGAERLKAFYGKNLIQSDNVVYEPAVSVNKEVGGTMTKDDSE